MNFQLYTNCRLVKGHSKSIIIDLQRNNYQNIPNSLCDILMNEKVLNFEKLAHQYQNLVVIKEYEEFLKKHDFVFILEDDDLNNFPVLNRTFEKPYLISNAIIEASKFLTGLSKSIKTSFDLLGVQDFVLIFYEENESLLNEILDSFQDSRLQR